MSKDFNAEIKIKLIFFICYWQHHDRTSYKHHNGLLERPECIDNKNSEI